MKRKRNVIGGQDAPLEPAQSTTRSGNTPNGGSGEPEGGPETSRKSVQFAVTARHAGEVSNDIQSLANGTSNAKSNQDEPESEDEDSDQEQPSEQEEAIEVALSESEDELQKDATSQTTPSKGKPGRPKGRKKQASPTPPPDGPPQEHYFFQNRPGGAQASNNTLQSSLLLTHDQYFDALRRYKDPHAESMDFLLDWYADDFQQWLFKLEQGFNMCLFGWGSKRRLLNGFAKYLATSPDEDHRILVVNGYHHSISLRDVIQDLARMIPELQKQKLSGQPADMITKVLYALEEQAEASPRQNPDTEERKQCPRISMIIHSMDWQNLRRQTAQALLARLAASPSISLVVSTDKPNVHLLWDLSLKTQFNFLLHDVTTFHPYDIELSGGAGGVVDEVNALLSRSGRKLRGREGVINVLLSLTESARRLYALFIAELLSIEPAEGEADTMLASVEMPSIEFRALKQKAVQQLIATGDMQFRQLLKEFFEHEMLTTKRDAAGTEVLSVPFRREECESILEDLALDEG
ncbi:MAG: Origin recognition complex subunit 2 [Chrysothrix sp. TS-e1954]|nr:MAG: Origin recognition complex subunit 2 [Chrysothrix sp. TS-e1954]